MGVYSLLLTFDAVSMHTNIDTQYCVDRPPVYLSDPLTREKFPIYPAIVLVEAIKLVTNNNSMRCADILVQWLKGTAMGMSPVPPSVNLYAAPQSQGNPSYIYK